MHARKQIRDAFVAALTGLTTTGLNVFSGRVYPVHDSILPGLNVMARNEEISADTGELISQNRQLSVVVQGHAKEGSGVDDELDKICAEVETAVFNDVALGNLCRCLDLSTTEYENNSEAEQELGICTMTFSVKYITNNGEPEVIQ